MPLQGVSFNDLSSCSTYSTCELIFHDMSRDHKKKCLPTEQLFLKTLERYFLGGGEEGGRKGGGKGEEGGRKGGGGLDEENIQGFEFTRDTSW